MSISAESALVEQSVRSLQRDVLAVAAACHFGARLWMGSLTSHLRRLLAEGQIRLVAAFCWRSYDSTP